MKYFFTFLFSIVLLNSFSGNSFWQKVSNRNLTVEGERKIIPQISNLVHLDDAAFKVFQQTIPTEESKQSVLMVLPTPDGGEMTFKVFESACMEKALADKYPNIKTYQAISIDNPFVTAKLDYTEFGFHAMVFGADGIFYIDPYSNQNTGYYNCYSKKGYSRTTNNFSSCTVENRNVTTATNTPSQNITGQPTLPDNSDALVTDGVRRSFRLALSCTIEYSQAVAGPSPTKPAVLSAMVTSVNRVNGVYEKDLSIHMNLVANNDTLIFITSDNFSNTNGGALLGQNQTVCDARIGNANYDIGHIFSTGGGGVAGLGVVCLTGEKANGVTGSGTPIGDAFDIDYVAHEIGHQFGANHTFNGGTGACGGNRNGSTAYEPGSGITIMGYAGICDANDIQPHSDDFFHRVSIVEIYNYIRGTSCATITNTGNTPPTVNNYVATHYVPYKTSFEITASATDADGHPVNYLWEEWDLGPQGSWNNNNILTAPLFRSFIPSASGTRVIPVRDSLVKNIIKYRGEVLPEVARDIRFRCTVKDIDPDGYGAFNAPDVNLLVKSIVTTSLFRVNSQATATNLNANSVQTITWDVAGTTAAPISCANVNIYLSLDSAKTFPYLLAGNVANDGSESVVIPDVETAVSSARIKVKSATGIFFDLNDGWLKINQPATAAFIANETEICAGSSITFRNTSSGNPDSVRWTINGGTPSTSNSTSSVTAVFNTSGTFSVSLIAYKYGAPSVAFTRTITVKPYPTIVFSPSAPITCAGTPVNITANYLAGATCIWSTGSSSNTITVSPTQDTYYSVSVTNNGCTSLDSVLVKVKPTKITNLSQTICDDESVTIGSSTFNTSGNYSVALQTSLGCDSTVNLNLVVNPTKTTNLSASICEGESYTIGSQTFSANGLYTVVLQSSASCDSTVNLNLTVNSTKITNISASVCEGESYTIGTQSFSTAGSFTVVLQTSSGCDSTVNLDLTIKPKPGIVFSPATPVTCAGSAVNISAEYISGATCIWSTGSSSTTISVAPTENTYYSVTVTNDGCSTLDSVLVTVNPVPSTPSITQSNDTLYSNVIIVGATYQWYNSAVLVTTTTTPFYKFSSNGVYTLKIINNNCESVLSASVTAALPTSVRNNKSDVQFSIIPNPNNGSFDIKINALKPGKYNMLMYNVTGQEMINEELNILQGLNVKRFNLSTIEKGMYFISLTGNDGVSTQNIIVQ